MTPLRLVFISRRFWPLVGGPERAMSNLAVELSDRGHQVTVLSAQWGLAWPEQVCFHEMPVVRVPPPAGGAWAMIRYLRALARWLKHQEEHYDLIYVSGLKEEAYTALRTVRKLRRRVPVVVRAERPGRTGDCLWQLEAPCGRRIKAQCTKAAALVAPHAAVERELKAAGYPRLRIRCVSNGVPLPAARTPAIKLAARAALAEANVLLEVPERMPLAVCTAQPHQRSALRDLVAAWQPIVSRWPNARLWLAGDGPEQTALREQIEAQGLTGRVLLVGVFDHVDTLLAAADVFVLPSVEPGTGIALLEAMAAGLSIVATNLAAHRALVADAQHALLVAPGDPESLAAAIRRLLDQPELAARLGAAARRRAESEFSIARMADGHVTLFQDQKECP